MTTRRHLLGYVSAISAAALLYVSGANAQSSPQVPRGGTVTFGIASEPPTLVSFWNLDAQTSTISPKITDGLLTFDADQKPVPQLATSWDVSPDGKQYTFHLRKGVKWHDGKPFTSRDVEFSLKLAREWHSRSRVTLAKLESVETPDDLTAIVKLSAPTPYLLIGLIPNEVPIVPRHLFEGTDVIKNKYNFTPVGTGPFKFEKWERGNYISVVRNDDYWGEKPANLDRIVFRILPNAAGRAVALETGEIDLAGWDPVPLADTERLEKLPHLAVNYDGYQYRPNPQSIEFNLRNPYFKDLRVREAVARSINRERLSNVVFHGKTIIHASPVSPFSTGYFKEIEGYKFDLAKANQLLDEAGFPRNASGERFSVKLHVRTDRSEQRLAAEFVQASLKQVGINASIYSLDLASWSKVYNALEWDFQLETATNMIDPALGVVRFFYTADPQAKAKAHNSGYSNPEVDRILTAALSENDAEKRYALWHQFQDFATREIPRVYFLTIRNYTVHNKRVKNFAPYIDGIRGNFAGAYVTDQRQN
ncbi:MAG TPA: ABC transporter substrate-binding protein [Pseudolabrys sp.]|nr:ABC transporter substrate-binding protein [Pseudolabrys sp.]